MTPDQATRDLISSTGLDRTLFVEAGAGTGKTTQLVDRITNLVLTRGVRLANVAAITFTEAAASELRARVRVKFEQEAAQAVAERDDERHRRAVEALADTDLAAISTLHGFAQRILSEHPAHSGLPPRIGVLDEVSSSIEQAERWERFVDSLYDDPANEELLLRAAALGIAVEAQYANHRTLQDVAFQLNQSWDRLGPVAAQSHPPLPPIDFAPIERAITEVESFKPLCGNPTDKLYERICQRLELLYPVVAETDPIERLRLIMALPDRGWSVGSIGSEKHWRAERIDEVRAGVKEMGTAREELLANACHEVLVRLITLIAADLLRGAEERRTEGRLEFHDLLVLASRLLKTSSEARAALHDRYRFLLLDEFQDTDPIQLELAVLIAASVEGAAPGDIATSDGETEPPRWDEATVEPGRLFFVGDPKQSIYRFRRADISLFLGARDHFGAEEGLQQLTTNFRTVAPIIEWINALFSELMPEEVPQAQPEYEPLSAHRLAPSGHDHRPILLGGPHQGLRAGEVRAAEAADVAAIVSDIRQNPHRWLVGNEGRPARLSDVTILIPTRTELAAITAALADADLSYHLATGTLIFQTQEVRDLLTILSAVDDPSDELSLVSALRSPFYGCADTDLFEFLNKGGRWDLRSDAPSTLAANHPVVEAIAHLRSLWEQRWWMRPFELLARVIDERAAAVVAFGGPSPQESWSRLRFIIDQAMAFDEADGGDLRAFLQWADLQRDESVTVHQPVSRDGDDDTVSIMTIHGSKGLEFPITIVAGTSAGFPRALRGAGVLWNAETGLPGVHLKKGISTLDFADDLNVEKAMGEYEQIRLLYVALTRARDHLVVSAHHRMTGKGQATDSFGSRIWQVAQSTPELQRWFDAPEAWETFEYDSVGPEAGAPAGTIRLADPVGLDDAHRRGEWIESRRQLLDGQRSSRTVSATALAAAAADETTAAGLVAEDDLEGGAGETDRHSVRPRRRGRAGTAIGRATHATLQLIDLHDPSQVAAEVERQAHMESIPELASVVAAMVRSAMESPTVRAAERYHREVYVAAPVAERIIEGYIDLLVETDQGLVVVDYKTDQVTGEADVDGKLDTYRLQGAAYAVALEAVTSMPVVDVRFIFCRSGGAIERSVPNLRAAMAQVEAACQLPVGVS